MVREGDLITIKKIGYDGKYRGKIRARVIRKYRRWVLVETEAGYRTSLWLDDKGRVMQ